MRHEDVIHESIVNYLKNKGVTVFYVPNDITSNPNDIRRALRLGMLRGVSDLIVLMPGRVVFMEVKTPTGTQSALQKKFMTLVRNLGFEYTIVRSISDAKTYLGLV